MLIKFRSVNKHGHHRQFLFLIGRFLKKKFFSETAWPNEQKLRRKHHGRFCIHFPKAEWKVSDTGTAHWASSLCLKQINFRKYQRGNQIWTIQRQICNLFVLSRDLNSCPIYIYHQSFVVELMSYLHLPPVVCSRAHVLFTFTTSRL